MTDCIFCKIIARELPSSIVAETDNLLVIKDIHPKASIHHLIITKKHIVDVQSIQQQDMSLINDMFTMAQQLSKQLQTDFRIVINSGYNAGQRVFHLHMHFLAGKAVAEF